MAADANLAITHVTIAGVVVFIINWLKKSKYFPWITAQNGRLLRILAVVGAGVGAIGIHYTWNPDAHSLTITGLSLVGVLTAAAIWLKSFVSQEIIYQATSKNTVGEIVAALKAAATANPSVTDSANTLAPAAPKA